MAGEAKFYSSTGTDLEQDPYFQLPTDLETATQQSQSAWAISSPQGKTQLERSTEILSCFLSRFCAFIEEWKRDQCGSGGLKPTTISVFAFLPKARALRGRFLR